MKRLLSIVLLAAASLGAQVSVGIRMGPPPAPRAYRVQPQQPGPDYIWVDGYWYPNGNQYRWHDGYWTRAPFGGARWVGPRHENGMYYQGYWDGERGRFDHDHRWDRDHDRDQNRRGDKEHEREDREHPRR